MFISFDNNEIRDLCLLLRPKSSISIFSSDQVKEIRAIFADLKAAPKLSDSPLKYDINSVNKIIEFKYKNIKIIGKVIAKSDTINIDQINRIKILEIYNIDFQSDSLSKQKYQ